MDWTYKTDRDHDEDKWSYDHYAVHKETGQTVQLDVSSNRPSLSVEEWNLLVELGFPDRSNGPGRSIGPLELTDLLAIKRKRERNHD